MKKLIIGCILSVVCGTVSAQVDCGNTSITEDEWSAYCAKQPIPDAVVDGYNSKYKQSPKKVESLQCKAYLAEYREALKEELIYIKLYESMGKEYDDFSGILEPEEIERAMFLFDAVDMRAKSYMHKGEAYLSLARAEQCTWVEVLSDE